MIGVATVVVAAEVEVVVALAGVVNVWVADEVEVTLVTGGVVMARNARAARKRSSASVAWCAASQACI